MLAVSVIIFIFPVLKLFTDAYAILLYCCRDPSCILQTQGEIFAQFLERISWQKEKLCTSSPLHPVMKKNVVFRNKQTATCTLGWSDFEKKLHIVCCAKLLLDPNSKIACLNVASFLGRKAFKNLGCNPKISKRIFV